MSTSPLPLLDAELRRFAARRAIRLVVLLGLLIATLVIVVQFARAAQTTQDVGTVTVLRAQVRDACVIDRSTQPIAVDSDCLFNSAIVEFDPPAGGVEVRLVETVDRRPRVAATFAGTIRGVGAGAIFPALILAATFLAADFGVAGLSTLLTFEPRRTRVYLVKLLAAAIGVVLALGLVLLWVLVGQYVISAARGSTAGIDGAWALDRLGDFGRVALANALAVAISFAVTVFARKTVAAVGVFFGLFIAQNFLAVASWGQTVAQYNPVVALFLICINDFSGSGEDTLDLTLGSAIAVAGVWAVALSALGVWWFRRAELR